MRDKLEEPLLEWILKLDKPALGICRGLQFFNGALGGDLYQDLPLEHPEGICHRQTVPGEETCHRVKLIKGSPLAELLGKETLEVNSLHHQAVRKLSPCLRMMAQSEDGLCEAAYMPGQKFIWAVQWHPEFRYSFDEDAGKLFEALIRATEI